MAAMKFLIYLTCFGLSQVFCDDYGESGKEITLTPVIRGKPEEILWTLNDNKVLEYDGSQVDAFGSFKDRVEVDFETGQLTIRKLNSQDTGRYQSEIWINKKQQVSRHFLTVLDALPEPRVTCEQGETTNDKTLTCSVESQTQISYEWIGPDVKQTGPTLLVKEKEDMGNPVYTCIVKNKAATRTTDFALQDCHTGNLAVLVPVLIIVPLLVIVLVLLALYLYRRKKQKHAREVGKAKLKLMDNENGVCDTLMENVEAVPGSLEATLPCRTRLTAPKESIADKKWSQGSESENEDETCEGENPLKESLQSAKTENEYKENTNEEELEMNQEKCESADEAGENYSSKADETEEIQKCLETQEGIEKSQILKDESEGKEQETETLGEQDTTDTDTNEEYQTPEDKEEENENSNTSKTHAETLGEQDTTDTNDEDQTPEEKEEENSPNTGVCDTLMENVEAVPGSLQATLPCRTRLTAPKESIADKKWSQGSESENEDETREGENLLKESLQSAKTENEYKENTNEGGLEINQEKYENADEAGENDTSKADETEEIPKCLETQEGNDKSQILKDESEGQEESSEEQTETTGQQDTADTDDEDQTHEEQEDEEEENSLNTVYTEDVAEQLHKNEKSSQNENRDQSAEQQNKCLDDRRPEEKEKTDKGNHEGTSRPHTDSPPDLDSVSSLNTNIELENKQTACDPQQEDDEEDQTDKSNESEQGMKEKRDVATA